MKPHLVGKTIKGKHYSTATATLLADEGDWPSRGRRTMLYRTPRKNYFSVTYTNWPGETDALIPLDYVDALSLWEKLPEKKIDFEKAFPYGKPSSI